MRQTGTEPHSAKVRSRTPLRVLARDALIVFAATGVLSIAIGLLPHFN
jgi:hypothetical protein